MNGLILSILICLTCLAPLQKAEAQDPLTAEQRIWLKQHGTIRVGMSSYYPPLVFIDEFKEPQGMAVDYWRLLSSKLGFWIRFSPDLFKNQQEGLKKGKYDSMFGIFPLPERKEFFDFSKPYTTIKTFIYVKPQHAQLKGLGDLKGLKVGAVSGDSGEVIARKAELNPTPFSTYRDAVFGLANGDTDALVIDEPVAVYFAEKFELSDKIVKVGEPVDVGQVTLPVRKGNKVLLDILNKGVSLVTEEEWKEIEERWLRNRKGGK